MNSLSTEPPELVSSAPQGFTLCSECMRGSRNRGRWRRNGGERWLPLLDLGCYGTVSMIGGSVMDEEKSSLVIRFTSQLSTGKKRVEIVVTFCTGEGK